MPTKKKPMDLESSLSALEDIVAQIETGDLSLEESLKAFEAGIKLTRDCQTRLTQAESQINKLIEQQGQIELVAFETPMDNTD